MRRRSWRALPKPRKRGTPNRAAIEIKTTPWVRALSLAAAWLASVASHSPVALSSCAVHTLVFACAWLVHGAVVPQRCLSVEIWKNAICIEAEPLYFSCSLTLFRLSPWERGEDCLPRRSVAQRRREVRGGIWACRCRERILTFPLSFTNGEATRAYAAFICSTSQLTFGQN